jgi:hypothetical protein
MMVVCSAFAKAQTMKQIDSVAFMMCDHLKDLKIANDTARLEYLYKSQLYPYLETVERSKASETGNKIYFRMQRNCTTFSELLERLEPPKEAVERLKIKPKPVISIKEVQDFKGKDAFYYFEVNGDSTFVSMKNTRWQDSFADGTVSKLDYNWINDYEFELTFKASNNKARSLFSVVGDTYIYQLLAKETDHYELTVFIPGQSTYSTFKLYYKE